MDFAVDREAFTRAIKAVSPYMSDDDTRESIAAIRFEVDGRAVDIIATDGHQLAHVQLDADVKGKGAFSLRASHVRALLDMLKRSKVGGIHVIIDGSIVVRAEQEMTFAASTCPFPAWQEVIAPHPPARPGTAELRARVSIDAAYLGQLGDFGKALVERKAVAQTRVTWPSGAHDPVRMDVVPEKLAHKILRARVVIMPMLDDDMSIADDQEAKDAARVTSETRTDEQAVAS